MPGITIGAARRIARQVADREREPTNTGIGPRRPGARALGPHAFVALTGGSGIDAGTSTAPAYGTVTVKLVGPSAYADGGTISVANIAEEAIGADTLIVCDYVQGTEGLIPVVILEVCDA